MAFITPKTMAVPLSGFVCAFQPAPAGSSPELTINAFSISYLNCVM